METQIASVKIWGKENDRLPRYIITNENNSRGRTLNFPLVNYHRSFFFPLLEVCYYIKQEHPHSLVCSVTVKENKQKKYIAVLDIFTECL